MTAIGSVVGGQESFSLNFLSSQWPQKHDSSLKLSKLIQYVLKINPFQRSGGLEGRRQKQWKIVILVFDWLYFAIAAWPVIEKGARPTTQMTKMSIVLLAYWKPIIVSLQLWLVPWNTLYMFIVKVHLHFVFNSQTALNMGKRKTSPMVVIQDDGVKTLVTLLRWITIAFCCVFVTVGWTKSSTIVGQ